MQLPTPVLVLLFCCTAQPAASLTAGAAWSWPWSSKPKDLPKSRAPVQAHATDLVERSPSSPAQAAESAPALQAEVDTAEEELKNTTGAREWAASAAKAEWELKLAEKRAAETALAAEAEQLRVQEIQAGLDAKQREFNEVAARQQAHKQASELLAKQRSSEVAVQVGTEAAGQTTADPLQDLEAQLVAKQRELKNLEAMHEIQALVQTQQAKLNEAVKSQQAKAQAARQAEAERDERALQAQRLASAAGAEQTEADRLRALLHELAQKQRDLHEVTAQAPVAVEQAVDTLKEPAEPGCYMRSPSACPSKPMKNTLWRLDSYAVKQAVGKEGCQARKSMWDKYCGSADTQMAFVAE